ncbi:MAG TPA: 1-(5-phosphoribosyl)-5-[(5-phosphoribosylamino)methylideneamino] imidazole-4-carboxamide isomerase [Candidatus Limnocylindrales bacterium]|nr:1-(5-phosphoribosyl)-5-[(5-phosphoribosylamino)methylideneamino] imidazole-4-carboxamide isomerase [Candidatus Limnocylindrales bacterium]
MLKRYHGDSGGARAAFELLPAIDLRDGRVVRLIEGDFGRETAYSDDPVGVALRFVDGGATWIHVVDLDGARVGEPVQAATIRRIARAVEGRARCQVAGGLRSDESVAAALRAGAARVVVGTAALADPPFAGRLVARHGPDRIVAAIDVRDGLALGEAWRLGAAGVLPVDAVTALADSGVTAFAATAIDRDGRLEGPDLSLLESLVALGRGRVIASGGIGSVDDIRRLREIGCSGAIVGTALYEGRIDLAEALQSSS